MMSQTHRASSYSTRKSCSSSVQPPTRTKPTILAESKSCVADIPFTVIHPGRPSSQYPAASRSPSYYATYPVATPSTMSESPPMPASITDDSPPFPGQSTSGLGTPVVKPVLSPIDTGLHRDNSSSSGERDFGVLPKHKSSIDRLRLEGSSSSDRAPSPASTSAHNHHMAGTGTGTSEAGSSRATSPHPSVYGLSRPSFSPENRYPRPPSMASLSTHSQTGRYLKPIGAPHAGRTVALEMPKPLGARPDSSGDFFWQTPKVQQQGFDIPFEGHQRRMSRAATELGESQPPMSRLLGWDHATKSHANTRRRFPHVANGTW